MASNNLSPRQKMINMMYLVLTALLALNISNEILQSFEKLRTSLEISGNSFDLKNQDYAEGIEQAILNEVKNGDSTHFSLRAVLQEIREHSLGIQTELTKVTQDIEEIANIDPKTGDIVNKDERDKNYFYWLGPNDVANNGHGNGKASELRQKLDDYTTWASQLFAKFNTDSSAKNPVKSLTQVIASTSEGHGAESGKETWEYSTFHGTPVVADLAMLEKFKLDTKEIESQLLALIRQRVAGQVYKINKLMAMEAPNARIVPAGLNFETRLFVGMSSENIKPEFMGSGIKMDPGGQTATMTISANGAAIPAGKNEGIQRYHAIIKVPRADGKFDELPLDGEFTVRKPEVVVRSKALQVLYKDCGNTVTVDVPALGDDYNPDFSRSSGGKIITTPNSKKDVTISPNRPEYKLSVYSKTNGQNIKIDDLTYTVNKPPKPRLVITAGGRELDGRNPIKKKGSITVKLLPDPEFRRDLPRDARYKVTKVKILYGGGLLTPTTAITATGDIMQGITINLNQNAIKNAVDGDRIFVELEDVYRINFEGKSFQEPMLPTERIQQFNLKN